MNFLILVLVFFATIFTEAEILSKSLQKYSKASTLQFDIKKTDEKTALGTKNETTGVLKYKKGQIYILQNGERKVEIFYTNKVLTLIEYPDLDFDPKGKRKVTVIKKANSPLIKSLLNIFSDSKAFSNSFLTISEKKEDSYAVIELKSKSPELKKLEIKIDIKTLDLFALSFVDEVDTKTTMQFSNAKLNSKMNKSEFIPNIQNGDEVITQ